jgi:hypothetical protein
VVADDNGGGIEVGTLDEGMQRVIVQMLRTTDVQGGKGGRIANIDDNCALFTQGLGLFRGDSFEFAHGGVLLLG